ncbi:MAG: hypothetical protein PSV16_05285 [Flavobacterium sp.]|nr:hypothetical protein [Flavobacterium sp.]
MFSQKAELFNAIDYDEKLENELFYTKEALKDSILSEEYYNKPINANCFVSGDFLDNSLLFCDCIKKNDTITIVLNSPVVCCFNELTIKITQNKFTSFLYQSYDISPAHVLFKPTKQQLILRNNNDDFIEGYINFEGKGKYEEVRGNLSKKEKAHFFRNKANGYFKCKVLL